MITAKVTIATPSRPSEVAAAVADALAREGFSPARYEADYIEARRGRHRPFESALLQARRPIALVPVVVCVSLAPAGDGTTLRVAAYPDLGGPGVRFGPVTRRTFQRATQVAVDLVEAAAVTGHPSESALPG